MQAARSPAPWSDAPLDSSVTRSREFGRYPVDVDTAPATSRSGAVPAVSSAFTFQPWSAEAQSASEKRKVTGSTPVPTTKKVQVIGTGMSVACSRFRSIAPRATYGRRVRSARWHVEAAWLLDGWSMVGPGLRLFELGGNSQDGEFVGGPTAELNREWQAVRVKAHRYGCGGLADRVPR